MKNKIKHFLVDLEEIREHTPINSNVYVRATKIKRELEDLLCELED
jgi:hypothetical protein